MIWLSEREIKMVLGNTDDIRGALQLAAKMGAEKATLEIWCVSDPLRVAAHRVVKKLAGENNEN